MNTGMTEKDFDEYHNYHIRFRISNGEEKSGVILDPMNSHITGKPQYIYEFISTKNMLEYKEAEISLDFEKMKQLKEDIDLSDIVWVERIKS